MLYIVSTFCRIIFIFSSNRRKLGNAAKRGKADTYLTKNDEKPSFDQQLQLIAKQIGTENEQYVLFFILRLSLL